MIWFRLISCLLLISSWYQVCTGDPMPNFAGNPLLKVPGNPLMMGIEMYENGKSLLEIVQLLKAKTEQSIANIDSKLRQLSDDFQDMRREITDIISNNLKDKITDRTEKLFDYIKNIEDKFERFIIYVKDADSFETATIIEFANAATSARSNELVSVLRNMYEVFVVPDIRGDSLLSMIATKSSANDLICIRQKSRQLLINDLYHAFVYSNAKGFIILLYSYEILGKYNNRIYQKERQEALVLFEKTTSSSRDYFKTVVKTASRELLRCDPGEQIKGVTYERLQQVFQGYFLFNHDAIIDNQQLNGFKLMRSSCADIKDARLNCESDICKAQPKEKRCQGRILNCQQMPDWFQLCHSPPESERKYDWMRQDMKKNEVDYGRSYHYCANTQGVDTRQFNCHECLCKCDSAERSIVRYFGLLDSLSDVDENKVVTGVQLVQEDYAFYLKIEQGTLGPYGAITDQPEWKSVNKLQKFQILDPSVSTNVSRRVKGYPIDYWSVHFRKNDIVYAVTAEQNNVYLDDLVAHANEAVTGLRFQRVHNNSMRLEIQVTPFDYATGKLVKQASRWVFNPKNYYQRSELKLTEPDDPLQLTGPNKVLSTHDQWIDFQMTDLKKDLGQQTVPYIDLQVVTTSPRMPLSGVGLILRGQKYSGGFLALKAIHYDFSKHL